MRAAILVVRDLRNPRRPDPLRPELNRRREAQSPSSLRSRFRLSARGGSESGSSLRPAKPHPIRSPVRENGDGVAGFSPTARPAASSWRGEPASPAPAAAPPTSGGAEPFAAPEDSGFRTVFVPFGLTTTSHEGSRSKSGTKRAPRSSLQGEDDRLFLELRAREPVLPPPPFPCARPRNAYPPPRSAGDRHASPAQGRIR